MSLLLAVTAAALCSACGGSAPQAVQAPAVDTAVDAAEKSFVSAVRSGDAQALGNLLDSRFEWISATGKIFNHDDTLKMIPKPTLTGQSGAAADDIYSEAVHTEVSTDPSGKTHSFADVSKSTYNNIVHTVVINGGKVEELRVWAKESDGWRLLVYQEVPFPDNAGATPVPSGNCDNPCKNIPFTPQDDMQKGVASAFMTLQSAAAAGDYALWNDHVGYEFLGATPFMSKAVDKSTALAELQQHKNLVGLVPTPVKSVTMEELPGVIIMRSKLQPPQGNPLQATSVWILRNDIWIVMVTFETAVQPN